MECDEHRIDKRYFLDRCEHSAPDILVHLTRGQREAVVIGSLVAYSKHHLGCLSRGLLFDYLFADEIGYMRHSQLFI